MKKLPNLIGMVFVFSFLLLGCGTDGVKDSTSLDPKGETLKEEEVTEERNGKVTETMKPESDFLSKDTIAKVSISNSEGFGKVNPKYFRTFADEKELATFEEMLTSPIRLDGIVDMVLPNYDLSIEFADGSKQGYHLWIGKDGNKGTLMKIDDLNTVYRFSPELHSLLKYLIQ